MKFNRETITTIAAFLFSYAAFSHSLAQSDLIDFETGFANQQPVSTVVTSTNSATFALLNLSPEIADVGGDVTAFFPGDQPVGGNPGSFFLSDGNAALENSYFMTFENPIKHLSLDIYDFEIFNGIATLRLYEGGLFGNVVGEASLPSSEDAGVITLSVSDLSTSALSAAVIFSENDGGNGIDNIAFTTIPEPNSAIALGLFSVLILTGKRRSHHQNR